MAAKEIIIFRLGDKKYGIDIKQLLGLEDYHDAEEVKKAPECMDGITTLRKELMPVINLHKLLKIEETDTTEFTRYLMLITKEGHLACKVDEVLEIKKYEEQDVHDFPRLLETQDTAYAKFVAKEQGELVIVIDPDGLLREEEKNKISKLKELQK